MTQTSFKTHLSSYLGWTFVCLIITIIYYMFIFFDIIIMLQALYFILSIIELLPEIFFTTMFFKFQDVLTLQCGTYNVGLSFISLPDRISSWFIFLYFVRWNNFFIILICVNMKMNFYILYKDYFQLKPSKGRPD